MKLAQQYSSWQFIRRIQHASIFQWIQNLILWSAITVQRLVFSEKLLAKKYKLTIIVFIVGEVFCHFLKIEMKKESQVFFCAQNKLLWKTFIFSLRVLRSWTFIASQACWKLVNVFWLAGKVRSVASWQKFHLFVNSYLWGFHAPIVKFNFWDFLLSEMITIFCWLSFLFYRFIFIRL